MTWNWQLPDWPNFVFDPEAIRPLEERFLQASGQLLGVVQHLSKHDRETFQIRLISEEALKTSAIEGEILDRESVQSSIRRHFGLQPGKRAKTPAAERGVSALMFDLFQNFDAPLNHKLIERWHHALLSHRKDLTGPGKYRADEAPMQVVSGPVHRPKVHFEAPSSSTVRKEMTRFLKQYAVLGQTTGPLVHSALVHLHFLAIHPFADGNGRIARAISEKALAEKIGRPTCLALAQAIEANKKKYYQALHSTNRTLRAQGWIEYFAEVVLRAQATSLGQVEFLLQKTKFLDRFSAKLNNRQEKIIRRLFDAGPDGFVGGLSAANYLSITGTTRPTATRDLSSLMQMGALTRTGKRRYARYHLNLNP